MTEEQFEQIMNARINKLFDLYPIEDLQPSQVTEEMKDGIAKSYVNKGFRRYLENAVKIAIRNMATAPKDQVIYYKSRIDVLEQLLAKGKELYETITPPKKGVNKNAV